MSDILTVICCPLIMGDSLASDFQVSYLMYRWSQNCIIFLSVLNFLFNASMLKGIVEDLTFHCSACKFTQPKLSYIYGRSVTIIKGLSCPLVIKEIAQYMGAFLVRTQVVKGCLTITLWSQILSDT